mgnify:CR=1 FL=1
MEILKLSNVTKKFGNYLAVDNLSMQLNESTIFGLLGPNGAGKTTTIRMITNILFPDNGEILIMGEKINPNLKNKIGYLPEERGLYKKNKVIEQLVYFGRLKGLSQQEANQRAKFWLNKVGATGWENKKIEELSKGMAQKVQFVATVLHNPKLLILDEPFSGFDPINTELIKNIILEMKADGTTIILSTHQMYQVEQLCDEILMINQGKVVLSGSLRDVKKEYGTNHLVIEFIGNGDFLENTEKEKIVEKSLNRVELKIEDYEEAQKILKKAIINNQITKFEVQEPPLNEIFIDVVSKTIGGTNEKQ